MREFLSKIPNLGSTFIINAAVTLVVLIFISLLSFLIIRIVNRRVAELKRRHIIRKITLYTAIGLALLVISRIWIEQMASITTILSAVAAGAVLALHQAILNAAGWILITLRRPYTVGDRIQIGETKGDVIDISLFWTDLLEVGNWVDAEQSTGRVVTCPNSSVLTTAIFNYTKGFEFIWNEIPILITFESDYKKAEQIIQKVGEEMTSDIPSRVESSMKRMSRRYMIRTGHLTPIVYTTIKDSGVLLTLRYLTNTRQRRTTEVEISRKILDAFAREDGIDFAYPTYRLYRRNEEQHIDANKQIV
jgi:small-conductance mechanosensitive channel